MEIVPLKTVHGEDKAWELIAALNIDDACARTHARYDPARRAYLIKCFGADFAVSPHQRTIEGEGECCGLMLGPLKDFFRLSVLWYFTSAMNIPLSGRLLRPLDVKGGQRFFAGTHTLPLDAIAERYATDHGAFRTRAALFGAEPVSGCGDACIRLCPLPRVPIMMSLWEQDDEFPARVDLFFDSTINFQIALSDISWSIAVICCLIFLEGSAGPSSD